MTNFEIITTYLKQGIHVGVKNAGGLYEIISPTKDKDGRYRASGLCSSLEEAKQYMGKCRGYRTLKKICKDWTDITPFHLGFESYPNGIKVMIIKTGQTDEIQWSQFTTYKLKNSSSYYSHTELIPYFEEEKVIEMTLAQIEEKLNIKGLKIIK